jgi:pimeloyl-ACP methyl ester carboxylesterase
MTHVVLIIFIVALSGVVYAARAEQDQRTRFAAPGQLVDIGSGQKIHIRTWGVPRTGEPVIVLDSSAGMPSYEWTWVGPLLGARHFVVAYDRPGMGWSTGPDQPRDAMHAADALGRALEVAAIAPPYIVIGHSFGGFSARAFAGTHRGDVTGLALLDSTDSDGPGGPGFALTYRLSAVRALFGLYALGPPSNDFGEIPAEERDAANAVSKWPSFLDTTARELEAWDVSAAAIKPLDLSAIPLLVVCSPSSPEHVAQEKHIATLSNDATYVELNVEHMGMLLNRDAAQLTAQTIESWLSSL